MSEFDVLSKAMTAHINKMLESSQDLFVVDANPDELWTLYLRSFPPGTDPIFRTRTDHDCSSCRHFMRTFGNVVTIKNNMITSIWDFADTLPEGSKYIPVVQALSNYIRSKKIINPFVADTPNIGVEKDHEKSESGTIITWEHMNTRLPGRFVNCTRQTADQTRGKIRDQRNVFKRSLDEISDDAIASVLELIGQNSLYRGEEWKAVLESFRTHKAAYNMLGEEAKELYAWEQSRNAGPVIGKIRNHSIGVLLVDISEGMDLDGAVRRYESIVAPTNYRRPKAIFTKKMLEDAERTITELGYLDSLERRHAILDDITVNNILFADRNVAPQLKGGSVFSEMASEVVINPKKFDRVEEVPIDKFVSEILPAAQSIQVLLENRHQSNMVSLIAPKNSDSPTMFKWSNGFSWAYAGNITDSMKMRVKALGGDISGVLRFSIQWGPGNENDFDAHCIEPTGNEIYFRTKGRRHPSSGMLDVDIIQPSMQTSDGIAVENITYDDVRAMREGKYKFFVHNYSHNGGRSGFTAEIEFDGQIYSFEYAKELRQNENVVVAEVDYTQNSGFKIIEKIPSSMASRKIWNLDTNQFYPVQVLMMSPNYWNGQDSIGNRHYFFMLKGCQNPENPNGFFNEYLKSDLLEHKRVFEALGSRMRVEPSENQLSGIGFSSTQRNFVIVKVTGHVDRILKVTF